jgi:vitamin-K-epoxide reductase (warfarin-sensitive)
VQPAVTDSAHAISSHAALHKRNRILFGIIAALALSGIVVSGISLQRHYARSATRFCDFNQQFSCDIVNRSEYSSIIGIPVAGIGVAGYGFLLALSTYFRTRIDTPNRLLGAACAGLTFAVYLTYVEARVLQTWCILCLISLALISLILVFAGVLKLRSLRADGASI